MDKKHLFVVAVVMLMLMTTQLTLFTSSGSVSSHYPTVPHTGNNRINFYCE